MSRSEHKRETPASRRKAGTEALVESVLRQVDSPERAVELFYWSQEPELLEAMRAIVAMRPAHLAQLCAFLAMAGDAESVAAELDEKGRLTLTSPDIAQDLAEVVEGCERPIEIGTALTPRIH